MYFVSYLVYGPACLISTLKVRSNLCFVSEVRTYYQYCLTLCMYVSLGLSEVYVLTRIITKQVVRMHLYSYVCTYVRTFHTYVCTYVHVHCSFDIFSPSLQRTPLHGIADVNVHALCDDFMSKLMAELGSDIPAFKLHRKVKISVTDSKGLCLANSVQQ